ncbi:MAG: hypothetical protein GXP62_02030 [Oligoflexia bacterium]|nr:hypothetical protein [Oligoflexia bacterium]
MTSRRKVLQQLGLSVAATGLVISTTAAGRAVAHRNAAGARAQPTGGSGDDPRVAGGGPWWLLAPLHRGSHLAAGWFVAHLSTVARGASVLSLQHRDGRVARVHLCFREGQPQGLAHTDFLDLVLMDGSQGVAPTDETLGRVVLGLAEHIKGNELSGSGDLAELGALQPHLQRVLDHGPESLS